MNFSSMEYFSVLAQELSFTRAAERLHITQQSLSSHIAGMEKELGCQLIVRHIPLEITYAGQRLLSYSDEFLRIYTDMHREFCDISQNQKGILRIGSSTTRGKTILPDVITEFQEAYPNISIEWIEGPNDSLHQMLLKGSIDLAIADFPDTLPGISLRDYYREEIVMLVSGQLFEDFYGDEASSFEEKISDGDYSVLSGFPFITGSREDLDGRIGLSMLRSAGISDPYIKFSSHNLEMLLNLCIRGAGACFCPKNIADNILSTEQSDRLIEFQLGTEAQYPIRFGYKERSYQWSVIEGFMACAINRTSVQS